jgi:hypothetical protein
MSQIDVFFGLSSYEYVSLLGAFYYLANRHGAQRARDGCNPGLTMNVGISQDTSLLGSSLICLNRKALGRVWNGYFFPTVRGRYSRIHVSVPAVEGIHTRIDKRITIPTFVMASYKH